MSIFSPAPTAAATLPRIIAHESLTPHDVASACRSNGPQNKSYPTKVSRCSAKHQPRSIAGSPIMRISTSLARGRAVLNADPCPCGSTRQALELSRGLWLGQYFQYSW